MDIEKVKIDERIYDIWKTTLGSLLELRRAVVKHTYPHYIMNKWLLEVITYMHTIQAISITEQL